MGRMRTPGAAAEELRRLDPESPISRHTVDVWARQGLIYSVRVGNRRLVSLDSLEAFLSGSVAGQGKPLEEGTEPPRGVIRRLEV